jgi:hypothetical protein
LDSGAEEDGVDCGVGGGKRRDVGGEAGEVGNIHLEIVSWILVGRAGEECKYLACFETLELALQRFKTFLSTTGDNDLLTQSMEASSKGFADA